MPRHAKYVSVPVLQILLSRSEKRQLGSRKGNTFSIAHFAAAGGNAADEAEAEEEVVDAKAFWSELLPEAAAAHAAALEAAKQPEVCCQLSLHSPQTHQNTVMVLCSSEIAAVDKEYG